MAVIAVSYNKLGRSGVWSATGPRTYVIQLQVTSNDKNDGPQTIINGTGHYPGEQYSFRNETDKSAFLEDISAEVVSSDNAGGGSHVWVVTLSYGPFDANTVGGGPSNNPLNYPPEIVWNFRNYEKVVEKDINGKAIANTAGDPFVDPPVTIDDPRPMLTINRNEAAFDPTLAYKFRNAVNSDPFCGADPAQAKVFNISGKRDWNQDIGYYWIVTYEFEFNPLGFHERPLNQGYREIPSGSSTPQHALDRGVPVTTPVLLDKFGARIPFGSSTDPVYLDFQVYPEVSFADSFNFPDFVLKGLGGKNQNT